MQTDTEKLEELEEDYKLLEEKLDITLKLLYPDATPYELFSMKIGTREIK